jgi:hypothetical protein
MPNLQTRSLRLGYKYFWDISNPDKDSWRNFYYSDYKFKTPSNARDGPRRGIRTGKGAAAQGPSFNLQPQFPMAASRNPDSEKAKEYQRKRLFSWSLYHNGDDVASTFSTRDNQGIPTQNSTSTDGGGRGGPSEVTREEGLKKFFWGMLRFPDDGGGPDNRQQIYNNRGQALAPFEIQGPQQAGSEFIADRMRPTDGDSLLGFYQRDILPKTIFGVKRLTEKRLIRLLSNVGGVLGIAGARRTLDTYSEEELGIIVMEAILDNISGGMDARQAVRQAVADADERRYESEGRQMIDIDPKYQPKAAAFLTNYFRTYANVRDPNFQADLDTYSQGGFEVSMVKNRLQAYYRRERKDFESTGAMVRTIARDMESDIERHIRTKADEGALNQGVGYGVARRYYASNGTFNHIYTSQMGNDGIAIYMIGVTNGQATVIPYVWRGPTGTLLNKMVVDLAGAEATSDIISELKGQQIGGITHTQMGNVYVDGANTTAAAVDFLGNEGGFGGKLGGGLTYVRTQVQTVTSRDLTNTIYDWVEAGALAFGAMVGIQDNEDVANFLMNSQMQAEKLVSSVEHQVDKGWREWADDLGGKKGPTPQEARSWSPFLHPRPYMTMDRRGGVDRMESALAKRMGSASWAQFQL